MQETAVRFAICDDDKTYAEKMKALILQTFQLPQPVECVIYLNQEQILKLLDNYIHTLEVMRTNIADADSPALLDAFTAAKDYRDSITITAKGALKNVYELYLDLIDETGGIATVATILASNNLSIKNIGIIHNREFEGGVLRLEMYDGESLALAVALLKKHHYTIYER